MPGPARCRRCAPLLSVQVQHKSFEKSADGEKAIIPARVSFAAELFDLGGYPLPLSSRLMQLHDGFPAAVNKKGLQTIL